MDANSMIKAVIDLAKKFPEIYVVKDERHIQIRNLTLTLTPCKNGAVMVTGTGMGPALCTKEFHADIKSLVRDVSSRAGIAKDINYQ